METWILQVASSLARLRQADRGLMVFGSSSHRYSLNPPISVREIEAVQEVSGVSLPSEYAMFVIELGNGGAGPGYGLAAFELAHGATETPEALKRASQPFPLDAPFTEMTDRMWELDEGDWSDEMRTQYRTNRERWNEIDFRAGNVLLADYGCGITGRLVLNGPFAGQVWLRDPNTNDFVPFSRKANIHYADEEEIRRQDQNRLFTFREWYEHWLAQCFLDLSLPDVQGTP